MAATINESVGSVVSLFSGAGGLDLGFVRHGFSPVWACDTDRDAVETYNKLIDGQVNSVGDARELADSMPNAADCIDLVIGGPPCQGFSVAGKMDPDDKRNALVFEFMAVVKRLKPKAFVLENVPALAQHHRWRPIMERLRRSAFEMDYCPTVVVLNAADFGVPQNRSRMFLIGLPVGHVFSTVAPSADPVSVRQALASLPRFGQPGNDSLSQARIVFPRKPVVRKSPYAGMLFNGQGRVIDLSRPAPTLPASMGGNRTPIIDQDHLDGKDGPWIERYHQKVLEGYPSPPEEPVPTRLRRLTVEEAAVLQGFPVGMYWAGSRSSQFRQIGNAVPPGLAEHVALSVALSLGLR